MLESKQILHERYQLQQKLGHNAGRQTWLATDISKSPKQDAIVKLLAFNPQMQWDDFKLFEREAEVLQNLNHPRIPRYRDSFSLDTQIGAGLCWFGLVHEYIPGISLRQMLDEGKHFTEAQIRDFATSILEILIYLHELNPPVLHRDIKPSNIILGENEQIYLVDFGAVQNSAAVEGATFTVVGTAGYTPLEQFWGRAVPASDLYALGATTIHLLTGTAPADLPCRNLRIQFSDRAIVSPSFVRWLEACASPDIDSRFTSARLALKSLQTKMAPPDRSPPLLGGDGGGLPLQGARGALPLAPPFLRGAGGGSPPRTRVQLNKSANFLKIQLPQGERSLRSIIKVFALALQTISIIPFWLMYTLLMFLLPLGVATASEVINIINSWEVILGISTILILSWGAIGLGKIILAKLAELNKELFTLLKSERIYLDKDYFVIDWQMLGYCYRRQRIKTENIKALQEMSSQGVTIQTEIGTYKLGEELSFLECRWLVQEIQEWLH